MVLLKDMKEGPEIATRLNVSVHTNVIPVKHHGADYRRGLIVPAEVINDVPFFYKIKEIVVKD